MARHLATLLVGGLLIAPAWAQPRRWSDDFTAVKTYDSASLYAPCYGGPSTKYTLIEMLLGDIYNEQAVSGGGSLIFTNRSTAGLAGNRAPFIVPGVLDAGQPCPDNPDPNPGASFTGSEPFTSDNICIYGGVQFLEWHLRRPEETQDIRGPDGKCGVANVDDDGDGITDEDDECLACRPTTVNRGYGNRDGTGFRGGVDAAPGAAGVDDDASGIIDDLDELGWPGSDDGDDPGNQVYWSVLNCSVATTSLIYAEIDLAWSGDAFDLRQIVDGQFSQLESNNEITLGYYQPHVHYNWVFCVGGTRYGAMLWEGTDMANPAETLGPLMNTEHTVTNENLVGIMCAQGTRPPQFIRREYTLGNSNFGDAYWVVSGNPASYYPSPSADLDKDLDVDGFDFLTFSNCYNGSNKPLQAACANQQADLDQDGDVDGFDFLTFSNCYNGSNKKPQSVCFPPNLTGG